MLFFLGNRAQVSLLTVFEADSRPAGPFHWKTQITKRWPVFFLWCSRCCHRSSRNASSHGQTSTWILHRQGLGTGDRIFVTESDRIPNAVLRHSLEPNPSILSTSETEGCPNHCFFNGFTFLFPNFLILLCFFLTKGHLGASPLGSVTQPPPHDVFPLGWMVGFFDACWQTSDLSHHS